MDSLLLYPIMLPIIAGLICLVLPKKTRILRYILSLGVPSVIFLIAIVIFNQGDLQISLPWFSIGDEFIVGFDLLMTPFARLVLIAAPIFAFLVLLYSIEYLPQHTRQNEFCAYSLATLGFAAGAVLANDLILFLFFWDLLGLMLYLLVMISGSFASTSATKALTIAVIADFCLLLGVIFIWLQTGTLTISELTSNPLTLLTPLSVVTFLLIMVGAFAKAGAIPMHSWIPAISTTAPMPTMAYLPASLDKLLGIYLLALISLNLFVMTPIISLTLMSLGAITILGAVLMALIQNDFRKMLAFSSVSQVGYMVLGIGTGVPVGVIGGLFHMLNNSIYKSCLFLCGGSVQKQTGRTEFSELGGLARAMPWTYITTLIAALAISGIPPLNGFVSKWLIYQGILEQGGALSPVFLVVAMFGSAITLAYFMKLLYSMFWGDRPLALKEVSESRAPIIIPLVVLASFCVLFGIFYRWPVENLIMPLFDLNAQQAALPGLWQSELATILLILSLLAGIPIYLLSRAKDSKEAEVFLGGETLDPELYRVKGSDFYSPVKEFSGLKQLYKYGERGDFDFYTYFTRFLNWFSRVIYQIDQALTDFFQGVIPSFLSLLGRLLYMLNARLVLTFIMLGVYALFAIGVITSPENLVLLSTARIIACVGIGVWAILAVVESDLWRLLLFAITSQLGFILLSLTLSMNIAISYLITAGLGLLVLILVGFRISKSMQTRDIDRMNGLATRKPALFVLFLLAAFWLSGLLPFGNFFSKYLLGLSVGEISLELSIIVAFAFLLTLAYLLRPIRSFLHTA